MNLFYKVHDCFVTISSFLLEIASLCLADTTEDAGCRSKLFFWQLSPLYIVSPEIRLANILAPKSLWGYTSFDCSRVTNR